MNWPGLPRARRRELEAATEESENAANPSEVDYLCSLGSDDSDREAQNFSRKFSHRSNLPELGVAIIEGCWEDLSRQSKTTLVEAMADRTGGHGEALLKAVESEQGPDKLKFLGIIIRSVDEKWALRAARSAAKVKDPKQVDAIFAAVRSLRGNFRHAPPIVAAAVPHGPAGARLLADAVHRNGPDGRFLRGLADLGAVGFEALLNQAVRDSDLSPNRSMEGLQGLVERSTVARGALFSELKREFGGVGIALDRSTRLPTVHDVLAGSAAMEAGIEQGDRLLAIDGVSCEGIASDDLIPRLRGAPRSTVRLKIATGSVEDPEERTLSLVRKPILDNLRLSIVLMTIGELGASASAAEADIRALLPRLQEPAASSAQIALQKIRS